MIIAGIVLYNPNEKRLLENVDAIMLQIGKIILVDNGSKNFENIKSLLCSKYQGIKIIHNQDNMGIAYALNQLMEYAHDYKWLLTLDQDSVISPEFIASYRKSLDIPNVALISPFIQERNAPKKRKHGIELIDMCITSGTLMNMDICKKIGNFDDAMFIDFVDFEYCYRVKRAGFKIIRNNDAVLIHELGNGRLHNLYFIQMFVSEHNPERHFYIVRNCCYLFAKYLDVKFLYHILKDIIHVFLFEHEKGRKMNMILEGIKAGVIGWN